MILHKYRIERLLGQAAFAQVYLATHVQLRVPRALKVLRRDAPGLGSTEFRDYRQRFALEAQLAAGLDHPHLIRVYDFEQEGEALILVMEYAAGGSLAERIAGRGRRAGPCRWRSACAWRGRWPRGWPCCTAGTSCTGT